jgi:TonB family protein
MNCLFVTDIQSVAFMDKTSDAILAEWKSSPSNGEAKRAAASLATPISVLNTHIMPPYPTISQRLGEQGTTILAVQINAAGDCIDASIKKSSGSDRLDQAAIDYVKARWKWQPTPEAGGGTRSDTAQVVWSLAASR